MTDSRIFAAALAATLAGLVAAPALAEVELSFYGGYQTAPHSTFEVTGDPFVPDTRIGAGWEGRSFENPIYYGVRATWWQSETFGVGLDVNHTKVYADDETLAETGFERLEFSDGLNIVTVNAYRRWPGMWGSLTPYVGGGIGISVPYVELTDGASDTAGYQYGGPAVAWIAGASYAIDETWSVFGEYKGTYSINDVDLDTGGSIETDIITNAINFGVSYTY